MTEDILTAAGIQHREAHFTKPPSGAYAVFFESKRRRGSDEANRLTEVSASIELYTTKPQQDVFDRLETALDERAGDMLDGWDSTDLVWIQSEQLYQKVYEFDYIRR